MTTFESLFDTRTWTVGSTPVDGESVACVWAYNTDGSSEMILRGRSGSTADRHLVRQVTLEHRAALSAEERGESRVSDVHAVVVSRVAQAPVGLRFRRLRRWRWYVGRDSGGSAGWTFTKQGAVRAAAREKEKGYSP